MVIKVCLILVTEVLLFSALLFGAAGTVRIIDGWPVLSRSGGRDSPVTRY